MPTARLKLMWGDSGVEVPCADDWPPCCSRATLPAVLIETRDCSQHVAFAWTLSTDKTGYARTSFCMCNSAPGTAQLLGSASACSDRESSEPCQGHACHMNSLQPAFYYSHSCGRLTALHCGHVSHLHIRRVSVSLEPVNANGLVPATHTQGPK